MEEKEYHTQAEQVAADLRNLRHRIEGAISTNRLHQRRLYSYLEECLAAQARLRRIEKGCAHKKFSLRKLLGL